MRTFFQLLLILGFLLSQVDASSARGGLLTFTQADGSKFEGYLRGDSAFHWIESHQKIVLYNQEDKSYYNAYFTPEGALALSGEKPPAKKMSQKAFVSKSSVGIKLHKVDTNTTQALRVLQKRLTRGEHPR